MAETPLEVAPEELEALLGGPDPPLLVDVREPFEHAHVRIEGSRLVPLDQLPAHLAELDPAAPLIAYCHHGVRSLHAVRWLRAQGFTQARSLAGGIDAWSVRIDPALRRY